MAETVPTTTGHPKSRFRPRFSLKTLLVAMALLSLWLGYTTHRARQQKEAVAAILAAGGRVRFSHQRQADHQQGGRIYDTSLPSKAPQWLVDLLGEDYFRSAVSVSLIDAPVTDDWLTQLDNLPSLNSLSLRRTNITGTGIARLSGLHHLEVLSIAELAGVTDNTLRAIGGCTRLASLDMNNCPAITDAGVTYLAPLVNLESLAMSNLRITDKSLVCVSSMGKLRLLFLARTHITDDGLKQLANLKELYWLDLRGTHVTDAGLRHLEGLTKLWQLVLWDTQVTPEGAERIEAALPNLKLLATGPEPTQRAPSQFPAEPRRGNGAQKE